MPHQIQTEQQVEHSSSSDLWHFYRGQWVEVTTKRANVEQYFQAQGQVKAITNNDIIYVAIGKSTPCFRPDELRPIPIPGGQAA